MSGIYFHSLEHDAVRLSGRERAHMRRICDELLFVGIGNIQEWSGDPHWTRKLLPASSYVLQEPVGSEEYSRRLKLWWSVGDERMIVQNTSIDPWYVALNTAIVAGSDPIKLCARLHAQCEIHAYVEGPNRNWLAGIIEQGRETGIFRGDMGWEDVVKLLKSGNETPIVTSFSVTPSFPNPSISTWKPNSKRDKDQDAWYDLTYEDQWKYAVKGLRKSYGDVELKPENWDKFWFSTLNVTGFNLREMSERQC